jgi:hypothetical protein
MRMAELLTTTDPSQFRLTKRKLGWFILNVPGGDLGPYGTRDDAYSDLRGLVRFYTKEANRPAFKGLPKKVRP